MPNKRYEITITEFVEEITLTKKEWRSDAAELGGRDDGYGYTPQVEQREMVERQIYQQNIDNLDFDEVIKAVNNL